MKKIKLFALALAGLALASCNFISVSGPTAKSLHDDSENLEMTSAVLEGQDFNAVDISLGCKMEYVMSSDSVPKVEYSYPEKYWDQVIVEVVDSVLTIRIKDDKSLKNAKVTVKAVSSSLNNVLVKGAIDLSIPDGLTVGWFRSDIMGAGNFDINGLNADTVSININGAGEADVKGLKSQSFTVVVNGAGNIKAAGSSTAADVAINGAGNIDISNLDCQDIKTVKNGLGRIKRK